MPQLTANQRAAATRLDAVSVHAESPLADRRRKPKYITRRQPGRPRVKQPDSIFCSRMANFLENPGIGFHYSVIDRQSATLLAPGYDGRRSLSDELSTAQSKVVVSDAGTARRGQALKPESFQHLRGGACREHSRADVATEASTPSGRLQLRTGGRKNHANDSAFAFALQVDVSVPHISMMRIAENIPATYPPYATVAPILHCLSDAYPADRSTTLNRSGAAA
jgi:hypothetical protein